MAAARFTPARWLKTFGYFRLRGWVFKAISWAKRDPRSLQYLDNEAIIAALVPTRGIGRWTVEMMLMFRLGRPDVLPVDDLGVRQGAMLLDGLSEMPQPKALMLRGEAWAPYRTLASFYLWRIADFRKEAVKRSQD